MTKYRNHAKKAVPFLTLWAFIFSLNWACKPVDPPADSFPDKIVLQDARFNTDSTQIALRWSRLTHADFKSYQLLRSEDPAFDPVTRTGSFSVIARIDQADSTTYVDRNVPYAPYLRYAVVGLLSTPGTPAPIASNSVDCTLPQRPFLFSVNNDGPYEILFHPLRQEFYLFYQSGLIESYTLQSKRVASYADAHFTIINFDQTEYSYYPYIDPRTGDLYVPTGFSYLRFPGGDLNKAQFVMRSNVVWSLATSENVLFLSSEVITSYVGGKASAVGGYYSGRAAKLIAFRNDINPVIHLLAISLNSFPTRSVLHYFKPTGEYISSIEQVGDAPVDHRIVRVAPDGTYLLMSNRGSLFDYNLVLKGTLAATSNGVYADYAFSDDSQLIYAANSQVKAIDVFDRNLRRQGSLSISGYPCRLFKVNRELIAICSRYPVPMGNGFPQNTVGQAFVVRLTGL